MEPADVSLSLLDRWRQRWRQPQSPPEPVTPAVVTPAAPEIPAAAPEVLPTAPEVLTIDMAAVLRPVFANEYPLADAAASSVLAAVAGVDLSPLARRSPGLRGYDWSAYLRCSVARVVHVQQALARHVAPGARVLDFGSYFGNFALALAASGYAVEAIDAYGEYGAALAPCVALQRGQGIQVHDFAETGHDLASLHGRFDAVVCAGVVEHIPHTPRYLMETLTRLLATGGVLVLDTPNLAYLYRRLALMEGQTIFPPIAQQYYTELPFEGHHREYTVAEVEWLLGAAGHKILSIETFNYSVFSQPQLSGDHVGYFYAMQADPSLREIIIAVSRPCLDA